MQMIADMWGSQYSLNRNSKMTVPYLIEEQLLQDKVEYFSRPSYPYQHTSV
jgi:hypothetical protein